MTEQEIEIFIIFTFAVARDSVRKYPLEPSCADDIVLGRTFLERYREWREAGSSIQNYLWALTADNDFYETLLDAQEFITPDDLKEKY